MKVFISHSWNDKSIATEINETLQKDGHEVWFDVLQLVPGDNIQTVIDAYIKKCDVVVLVWSIHSFSSDGVEAEIDSAILMKKRIIPLLFDPTPLDHQQQLRGLLGIPFEDKETGKMLLQRALLMLMATESFKEAPWFKEAFGNITDLGGYLNYANTYRLAQDKNEDGCKEQWVKRLEDLKRQNEFIRQQIMPQAKSKMEELQLIMQQLEHGNASITDLEKWKLWCDENKSFQPELVSNLKVFIDKDIRRLNDGGLPVSVLKVEEAKSIIERLATAIEAKKDAAYLNISSQIAKYAGLFINQKIIDSIAKAYINYVSNSPILLQQLVNEAMVSEYIAVKEATVQLLEYLENQDHEKEMDRPNLDGYFDDAYLITNSVKLLIEAKLIKKENFALDFVAANLVDKYVGFLLDAATKSKLTQVLQNIRNTIGLKKNEINWGQVAALVLGAAVVGSAASLLFDGGDNGDAFIGNSNTNQSPYFEDKVAAFSAKYGGGLDANIPIQY